MTTLANEIATVDEVPEGHGVLAILDRSGDTKLIWDPSNQDEVANAKRTFDDLKKKGYAAFSVKKNGDKGEVLSSFDATAEKIIMAPALRGG